MLYDDIDMRNEYRKGYTHGYWFGSVVTFFATTALYLIIGYVVV